MAIWDNAVEESRKITKASADTHKCPGCGSNLIFNDKNGQLNCKSCGSQYYPEFFEISDLLTRTNEEEENDFDDSDKMKKQEIICNTCGATVVTDHNTASTFCAFCGSPALVTNRLTKAFKPDYIIPFKLTKKDAEAKFKEWAASKKFIPKDFTSEATLKKITGIYVPFWIIDAECHVDIEAGGSQESSTDIRFFSVNRKGTFRMRKVPFDGSKHINDRLMESIEPFDYSELVPYSSGYLPGYFAERYDLSVKDMAKRISDRFRDYMFETRSAYMNTSKYDKVTVDYDRSTSDNYECKYALLPVWFLNYEYEGLYYRIAINGQTGEISGKAPVNTKQIKLKKALTYAWGYGKLLLLGILILWIIYLFIKTSVTTYEALLTFFIGLPFITLISGYLLQKLSLSREGSILNKQIRKIEKDAMSIEERPYKMPPASTYIDGSFKSNIEAEDKFIHTLPKVHIPENSKPYS